MTLLVAGVLIWILTHWIPSGAPGLRTKIIAITGTAFYRACFAVTILVALGLIIAGWKSSSPVNHYIPTLWMRQLAMALVLIAFLVMGAFKSRGQLNRIIRHPQLTAVALWATGHLLANGDSRSLVLFGGMLTWAVGSILLINRRDGLWHKPAYGGFTYDIRAVAAGLVMFVVFFFCHPWIAGVALM